MARQNTLPVYRIYTRNEDKDCLVAHNYAPPCKKDRPTPCGHP
jgi:hypothetical protein